MIAQAPHRRGEKPDHHELDDEVSVLEQLPDREIDGDGNIRRIHACPLA
jgi:hypothetical protein